MIQKFLVFLLIMSLMGPSLTWAAEKPYHRALVLSGGGMQTATYLGLVEGLMQAGWTPDIIISTCGSSIAAGIIQSHPDPKTWHDLVRSSAYRELVRSVKIKNASGISILMKIYNNAELEGPPSVFKSYALDVPQALDPISESLDLNVKFKNSPIPVVMVAAEFNYGPADREQKIDQKSYHEVYFTDANTALILAPPSPSPMASEFPKSHVASDIKIITSASVAEATRASISDPYLMSPMKIGDKYFLTGGIDLYPIEQARALADEVVMLYSEAFESVEVRAIKNTFGFDPNQRLAHILQIPATHWIDLSDESKIGKEFSFDPKIDILNLVSDVPGSDEEFARKVESQWELGRSRAIEALKGPENDKSHIRSVFPPKKEAPNSAIYNSFR